MASSPGVSPMKKNGTFLSSLRSESGYGNPTVLSSMVSFNSEEFHISASDAEPFAPASIQANLSYLCLPEPWAQSNGIICSWNRWSYHFWETWLPHVFRPRPRGCDELPFVGKALNNCRGCWCWDDFSIFVYDGATYLTHYDRYGVMGHPEAVHQAPVIVTCEISQCDCQVMFRSLIIPTHSSICPHPPRLDEI